MLLSFEVCLEKKGSNAKLIQLDIGAWANLTAERIQPYHQMRVWDGISGAKIDFASDEGQEMGYMVENANTVEALLSTLSSSPSNNIELLSGVEVASISADDSQLPVLSLANGSRIKCRLLVGADGPNSPVRQFTGTESHGWAYNHMGVVATLHIQPEFHQAAAVAFQRFLPLGPIALLPLPNNTATLVWSTHPEIAKSLSALPPLVFCSLVQAAFRLDHVDLAYLTSHDMLTDPANLADQLKWRLGLLTNDDNPHQLPSILDVDTGSVATFPLAMRHVDDYVFDHVALIGDAAHTVHPLAGQGLNQGLSDADSLATALDDAVSLGQDIGALHVLQSYSRARYFDNNAMLGVVDKLHKLYSTSSWPMVMIRSVGLQAVDRLDFAKRFLMRQAGSRPS